MRQAKADLCMQILGCHDLHENNINSVAHLVVCDDAPCVGMPCGVFRDASKLGCPGRVRKDEVMNLIA